MPGWFFRLPRTLHLILAFITLGLSANVRGETLPGATFFQTNVAYDPRIALEADFVVVHQHEVSHFADTIRSWQEAGWKTGRMFFIGSDAARIYTTGGWDGKEHLDEAETTREGNLIECAGVRPYMVPTEGWKKYIAEKIEQSIEAGAVAILPEEPLAHTKSGYGEAFKRIWQERYGTPWLPPHESPNAFFQANHLKSDLYFELVENALVTTDSKAAEMGREVSFLLPIHSLLSHAAGNMLYPSGRTLSLAEKGLDGFVGQVWTGPVAWSMSWAEGERMDRNSDFFESAYLLYSYFGNLVADTGLPCYLLADPVEDDPQYTWEDYRKWYNECLVAMLLSGHSSHFEIMPWPDRVFLPGFDMASGTPGPEDYRRALMNAFAALNRIAQAPDTPGGPADKQVGVLVSDTLPWQRGGPEGSDLAAFHGLAVPLLRRGIPVEVALLERHADSEYLDRFGALILSYDAMKPLDPAMNSHLADWVRRGGTLIALGGADLYNQVDSWWKTAGFESPMDHLLEELGVWTRTDERFYFKGPREILSRATFFNEEGINRLQIPREWVLTDYHFPQGKQLYGLEGKESTPHCGVLSQSEVGQGRVIYCGLPAAWFGRSESGGKLIHQIVRWAANQNPALGLPDREGGFERVRGEILAVRTGGSQRKMEGSFVDLLNPNLPLLKDPVAPPHTSLLYASVDRLLDASGEKPVVLFAGPQVSVEREEGDLTRLLARSPEGTPATLRLAAGGRLPQTVRISDTQGTTSAPVLKEWNENDETLLLVVTPGPQGKTIEVHWTKAQAETP